jgi:hypothetical protein
MQQTDGSLFTIYTELYESANPLGRSTGKVSRVDVTKMSAEEGSNNFISASPGASYSEPEDFVHVLRTVARQTTPSTIDEHHGLRLIRDVVHGFSTCSDLLASKGRDAQCVLDTLQSVCLRILSLDCIQLSLVVARQRTEP